MNNDIIVKLLMEIYEASLDNWDEWLELRSLDWQDEVKDIIEKIKNKETKK
jgi:hypothetical protein